MKNKELIATAKANIREAKKTLDSFAKALVKEPVKSLTFGTTPFAATAAITVWQHVLNFASAKCSLAEIVDILQAEMTTRSSIPSYSASIPANFLAQETLREYAKVYKELSFNLKLERAETAA